MQSIIIIFLISFVLTLLFTRLTILLAVKLGVVDKPNADRKQHGRVVPLLGGLAVFTAYFIMLFFVKYQLLSGNLNTRHWLGFFVGACFLVAGGWLDDKYNIKAKYQIIFPLLAAVAVIAGGVEIEKITNPLGGLMYLDNLKIPVLYFGGVWHYFIILSDTFVIIWLLGMMYTTKLLDGMDGLVTGVTAIGAFIIFLFTMTERYYQPDIGIAALVLTGVCLGFLIFNWYPAKIFLGEGGSLLMGYSLGVLAIISGGKIAIALLVMGIPIMDVAWTIIRRLKAGRNPFTFSDREHLHFRLLDSGLGQKKTVLIYYALALVFGSSTLILQSRGKVVALFLLLVVMTVLVVSSSFYGKKKSVK